MAESAAKLFQSLEASRMPGQPPRTQALKMHHLLSKGGKLPFTT